MIRFFIQMPKEFDSRKLWEDVQEYKVNVLDIDNVWVYGEVSISGFIRVLRACLKRCQELRLSTKGDDVGGEDSS